MKVTMMMMMKIPVAGCEVEVGGVTQEKGRVTNDHDDDDHHDHDEDDNDDDDDDNASGLVARWKQVAALHKREGE